MAFKPVFPLQQGDLDYLCSIYAVLNLADLHGTIGSLDVAKRPVRLDRMRDSQGEGRLTRLRYQRD